MTALYTVLQLCPVEPSDRVAEELEGFQGGAGTVRHDVILPLAVELRLVGFTAMARLARCSQSQHCL